MSGRRGPAGVALLTGTAVLLAGLLTLLVVASVRPARPAAITQREVPALALPRLSGGEPFDLGSLRGRPALINFWASWCAECRSEFAALRQAWTEFRDRGVVFVGIAFQDTEGGAREFLAGTDADWIVLFDRGSRAALSLGVTAVPQTFFVSPTGRVVAVHAGAMTAESLIEQLSDLTRSPP